MLFFLKKLSHFRELRIIVTTYQAHANLNPSTRKCYVKIMKNLPNDIEVLKETVRQLLEENPR